MSFVHLHTHSHYSLLDGLTRIEELVAAANADGQPALALTDHGTMHGAVEFSKACRKVGVKPIIGMEAYLAPRSRFDREKQVNERAYYHLVLLAKNRTGYQNLLQLSTLAHLEGFYYKPRIDWELLETYGDGLIALTACLGGEIPRLIRDGKDVDIDAAVRRYRDRFGSDFYFELQHRSDIPEAKLVNAKLIALSERHGIPLVATNDIHYLKPEDAEAHDVLLCLQTKSKQSDTGRLCMLGEHYGFRTAKEMTLLFEDHPEAIENTLRIADACNFDLELGKIQLPAYALPQGETNESYLRKLCEDGLERRYADLPPTPPLQGGGETGKDFSPSHWEGEREGVGTIQRARERLDYELGVITKMGLASYFIIVQDFVNWAKQNGIVVGPGRGSAAGSIVSYLCNITNLDPLAYDLLFERFLAPGRIQMPDIDIDFADHRRDEVIRYVKERYGEDHVAQIITFGTMAARAAVRDVGRVLDVPYQFCDRLAKLIPMHATLADAERDVAELRELIQGDETTQKLFAIARRLEGVARHASTHACGVVITADPLVASVPLQRASADDATIVTQYEMHAVEDLGLLKMDFLGLSNLSIIEHAVNTIRARGETIDIDQLPLDDAATYALLQRGESTGVFQLECLSGDTVVSNITIKKLHDLHRAGHGKEGLRSVYLDTGTLHNNRVLEVKQSGKKRLFRVVSEDGRIIKASAEHQFLTTHGWKRLADLVPGSDALFYKPNAKHVVLHACRGCGVQREVMSENGRRHQGFCYRCSAKHFRNPSKPSSRQRIAAGRRAFYAEGGTPWNLGLTAETSEILRENGPKIRRALEGRSLEDRVGAERAVDVRRKLSERSSGKNNPMFGKKSPHRKGGFRPDLGHYVRSNWEADFARILRLHGIAYEYEPQTFTLRRASGEVLSYTPDFYTPHDCTFYEIKGWMHDLDAEKIDLFQVQYPQYHFVLISASKFAEFAMQYRDLVAWECPMVPNQLSFTRVREVAPLGEEETYDIVMATPGNNFIANSFVVHNSGGMKRYLKELKPTEFEDIVAMVSLYRPGPMELIPEYIDRKFGRKPVTYLHPKLEPILKRTYGIMVYQEQLMSLARDLAGFTMAQADTLRKAVGKKIKKLLDEQREKLTAGMVAHGIMPKISAKIWEWIEPFARYGFNRSHAACYAFIAYQTAYLKAHYPVEFMAALLTSERGSTDRLAILIQECREMGIPVLGPDVNESEELFSVVGHQSTNGHQSANIRGIRDHSWIGASNQSQAIRFGLAAIKNVGEHLVEALVAERKVNGPFCDLSDLLQRVQDKDFNKKSLECLIKSGCLDRFAERGQLLANVDALLAHARAAAHDAASKQANLFGGQVARAALRLATAEPTPQRMRLAWEKELLGLYLSAHPFAATATALGSGVASVAELKAPPSPPPSHKATEGHSKATEGRGRGEQTVTFGGVVTRVKRIVTKGGEGMLFAEVEDHTGSIEAVVFPRVLTATASTWIAETVVLVRGKLSDRDGVPKVLADHAVAVVPGHEADAVRSMGSSSFSPSHRDVSPPARAVLPLPEGEREGVGAGARGGESGERPVPRSFSEVGEGVGNRVVLQLPNDFPSTRLIELKAKLLTTPGPTPVLLRTTAGRSIATGVRVAWTPETRAMVGELLGPQAVAEEVGEVVS